MAQPSIFIPHGGGPCFFMDWTIGPKDTWERLRDWLAGIPASLPEKPNAMVVLSAHWEESEFTVLTGDAPSLLYDYYGFPPHTYELTYPAPGAPGLAARIQALLQRAGFECGGEAERGFDHGVFIPLKVVYPDADIPIVQLSLKAGLDPMDHVRAGQALAPLREEGVLILGSGMSPHNLDVFRKNLDMGEPSVEFDAWMTEVCAMEATARARRLSEWAGAPYARLMHPREEHLIPLMIVSGAAGESRGERAFSDYIMGGTVSAFRFD